MNKDFDIVIVEDNLNDSELMVRSLKKYRLCNNYLLLEDGEEAMDFFQCKGEYVDRSPDLKPMVIFLDLKLPKVHGLDILRALKSNENTRTIPVVVITSSKEDPDIRKAYELGVNSYVVKPVDFSQFLEAIKNVGFYWMILNESSR